MDRARPVTPGRRRRAALACALAAAASTGCFPRAMRTTPVEPEAGRPVRVREAGAAHATAGRLVRLTADSVTWQPDGAGSAVRAQPLAALARVEVAERISQAAAFRGGAWRGALVGAALGGALLVVRHDAAGGAAGLALGGAWLGGVLAGQHADSPRPPRRWRVVHPRTTR